MPDPFDHLKPPADAPERRSHARQPVRAIGYVQLDESNGGIILNINESGLAVCAVASLMDDHLPKIRFQLPDSKTWIEASGNVVWRSRSDRLAGIQLSGLSEEARSQIREWCYSSAEAPTVSNEASRRELSPPGAQSKAHVQEEAPASVAARVSESALPPVVPPVAAPKPSAAAPLATAAPEVASAALELASETPRESSVPESSATVLNHSKPAEIVPPGARDVTVPTEPPAVVVHPPTPSVNPPRGGVLSYPADTGAEIGRRKPLNIPASGTPAAAGPAVKQPRAVVMPKSTGISPLSQPESEERGPGRLILILGVCAVLSLAAGWEAGRGALHPYFERFFARNQAANSDSGPTPTPESASDPESSAARAGGVRPAAEPPAGNAARSDAPVEAAEPNAPPAASALAVSPKASPPPRPDLPAARNNTASAFSSVILSAPVRSPGAHAVQVPDAPRIQASREQADTSNNAPALPAVLASSNSGPAPPPTSIVLPRPGALIHHVNPHYPAEARASRIEGTVTLHITIGVNGKVTNVQPVSGAPSLIPAAVNAVRQWRYEPARLNGRPVETQEDIAIEFHLP